MSVNNMEKKITAAICILALVSCLAHFTSAETCPYDEDYKYSLKKTLVDYLKTPSSSAMPLGDVKQMLNFYLSKPSVTDIDCPPEISSLVNKADTLIPDSILDSLGGRGMGKCTTCSDGSICGQKNQKDQTCTCKDVDGDGKNEYCYLHPFMPAKKTCDACADGTLCGQTNQAGQNCICKDWNFDGSFEFCFLRPREPSPTTSTSQNGSTTAPVTTSAPTTTPNPSTSAPVTSTQPTTTQAGPTTTAPVTTIITTTTPVTTSPTTTQIVTTTYQITTNAYTTNYPITTDIPITTNIPITTTVSTTWTMPDTTIPDGGYGDQCDADGGFCTASVGCDNPGSQEDCPDQTICCFDP
jgi:hypothetical protein